LAVNGVPSEEYLRKRAERWPFPIRFVSGLGSAGAVDYVRGEGRLVVFCSRLENSPYVVQEALENGVPIIAADAGGVRELVHPADRARVLLPERTPRALSDALVRALAEGGPIARPIATQAARQRAWLSLHREIQRGSNGAGARPEERSS